MISELFERQKPLMVAGVISFVCFAALIVIGMFDSTQVLGVNRWIKPIKFFISISIFVWTVAVYLNFLKGYDRSARFISWGMIVVFSIEMIIIVTQAGRGTTSHFNIKTPLDGILFAIMGMAIFFNTLLAAHLLFLYFKAEIELPNAILWGMRLGIIVFLLGSIQGGYMSAQPGHAVGVADGGAGLPLVNWSTTGGDLRVAHFFGLHAIQSVPIAAYVLEKFTPNLSTILTFVFAIGYFSFFSFLFIQALFGRPFGF